MWKLLNSLFLMAIFCLSACQTTEPEQDNTLEKVATPFFQCTLDEDNWTTTKVEAVYHRTRGELTVTGKLHKNGSVYDIILHIFEFEQKGTYLFTEGEKGTAIATAQGIFQTGNTRVNFNALGSEEYGGKIQIFDFNDEKNTITGSFTFQMLSEQQTNLPPYIVIVSNGSFKNVKFDVIE